MTTNKGFGSKPNIDVIPLQSLEPSEVDRLISAYRRQGLSKKETMRMMSASLAYYIAKDEGLEPGVDIQHDPEKGFLMSEAMTEVMKSHTTPQQWRYMEMEQFITHEPVVKKPKEQVAMTPVGLCKFLLLTARDPSETIDGGERVRTILTEFLMESGLTEVEAGQMIREWIDGDDSLEDQMIERMKASAEKIGKNQQQKEND